jgi:hypothetical protein
MGVAAALLLVPTAAQAASSVTVSHGKGAIEVLDTVQINGVVGSATPGSSAELTVTADGKQVMKEKVALGPGGSFSKPLLVNRCCQYKVVVAYAGAQVASTDFDVSVPKLRRGPLTKLFHDLLREEGYHVKGGRRFNGSTRLAILAFRKVNGMGRNERFSKGIFRKLLAGEGGIKLAHPDGGKHVEVDLSRQVMVLAEGGEPRHTFHISSGAGGTPTVTGKFRFYMKQPGYNSNRMYFSVYFIGGYATHGYNPVPKHPASHGCVRNPIPFARFIYNWINLGDPIWVYH